MLLKSVPAPTAVFNWPSTLLLSENQPTAVLLVPVLTLRLKRAFWPSAVLPPGYPPSGGWNDGLRYWRKRESEERQCDEKWWSYVLS